jgi:hypothetical protein
MDKKEKRSNKDTSKGTGNTFPCAGFQEMFEMMSKVCRGKEGGFDCCSMMKRMMDEQIEKSKRG